MESIKLKDGISKTYTINSDTEITDKTAIRVDGRNNGVVFYFQSGGEDTIVLYPADSVLGGVERHIKIPSGEVMVAVDIGPYIQTNGEYKGCVIVKSTNQVCYANLFELI
jgi:hypothetical protein